MNGPLNPQQQLWRIEMANGLGRIPAHMQDAIHAWMMFGRLPGDFLRGLLRNDARAAVLLADDANLAALPDWLRFLHNHCPPGSHGSIEAVVHWNAHSGLAGTRDAILSDAPRRQLHVA